MALAALAHVCHLCLRVDERHALLLHLQHHLLRPHLPFGVQQTQASHAVLHGHHPVFPVQHKRGQVLQVSHNNDLREWTSRNPRALMLKCSEVTL